MKMDFSKLPKHWKVKKLKEIVKSQKGKAPIHWFSRKINGALPYLDVDALANNNVNQFADWYSTLWIDEQDICVLWDGGRNGLILKGKKGALGSTLYGLTPLAVNSDYLFYYLKTKEELRKDTRHVENTFWEMEIPIPPIEEQIEIVKSIEENYQSFEKQNKEAEKSLLDSFKKLVPIQSENLENILSLEDLKKAVLDLAVSGKLTEKWRRNNDYQYVDRFLVKDYYPKSWTLTPISELGKLERGKSKHRPRNDKRLFKQGNIPFIQTSDVSQSNGYIYKHSQNYNEFGLSQSKLFPKNTLCITIAANISDVGVLTYDACFPDSIVGLIPYKNTNSVFYMYFFKVIKNILVAYAPSNAQKNINLEILKKIYFPSPSLEEQTEIVNLVESIFAEADKIQQDFELQKKQQDDLLKSVINAFFQFSTFSNPQTDWDLDAQIKAAREKKEKEIQLLKEKQMAKKKEEASKPKPDILSLLKESGISMPANELLEQSKFNGNTDDFYAEAKKLVSEGTVKWEMDKDTQNTETPLSMLFLAEQTNEN